MKSAWIFKLMVLTLFMVGLVHAHDGVRYQAAGRVPGISVDASGNIVINGSSTDSLLVLRPSRFSGTVTLQENLLFEATSAVAVLIFDADGDSIWFKSQGGASGNHAAAGDIVFWIGDGTTAFVTVDSLGQMVLDGGGAFGATTGLQFGDGNTGFHESADNILRIRIGGTDKFIFQVDQFGGAFGTGSPVFVNTPDATAPVFRFDGDPDVGMGRGVANELEFYADFLSMTLREGQFSFPPSADQALLAANALTITSGVMRVAGSSGAVTLTSTPSIVDGLVDGTLVIIQGTNDTNTLTFQDEETLASSGIELGTLGTSITLGIGNIWAIVYDSGDDKWYTRYFHDN